MLHIPLLKIIECIYSNIGSSCSVSHLTVLIKYRPGNMYTVRVVFCFAVVWYRAINFSAELFYQTHGNITLFQVTLWNNTLVRLTKMHGWHGIRLEGQGDKGTRPNKLLEHIRVAKNVCIDFKL